ncbi:regucalcin-like [Belonocnema kinseyi]|uniref:regucalcin-like n=1 Tax=Belonocnema kinseyi TaxID=2817044 RepID=UPI00143CF085|nr:regucalcin-like [Belonocnema kinseyi]
MRGLVRREIFFKGFVAPSSNPYMLGQVSVSPPILLFVNSGEGEELPTHNAQLSTYELHLTPRVHSSQLTVHNSQFTTHIRGLLSFAVPVEGHPDKYVVGVDNKILLITWNSYEDKEDPTWSRLITVDERIPSNRLNYGTVDPKGRLFFGTMNEQGLELANVSSLNFVLDFTTHLTEVISSSGFVWDSHATHPPKVYVIDSKTEYNIVAYHFHNWSGKFGKNRVVFNWKPQSMSGSPRRLTFDRNGNLWVPLYDGHGVIQVNHITKKVMRFIGIPALRVGACIFGGPDWNILFVSTMPYVQVNHNGQHL